jgi:hypothetical protein
MDTEADITEIVLDAEELHALNSATISDGPEVRQEIQKILAERRGDNDTNELSVDETQKELYALAKVCWSGNYSTFKRFETLIMFDLLQYQHELVELDDKIRSSQGIVTREIRAQLRNLIREYRMYLTRDRWCISVFVLIFDGRRGDTKMEKHPGTHYSIEEEISHLVRGCCKDFTRAELYQ